MNRCTLLVLAVCSFTPGVFGQPALETIRSDWKRREYVSAHQGADRFRKEPYGKQPETYFIGGTSLCRIRGEAVSGMKWLDWMLENFSLSAQDRATVQNELKVCALGAALPTKPPVVITFNTTQAMASSSGRTKMYYFDGGNNALKSIPVEVVRTMDRETLEQRLYAPRDADRAKAEVGRLAGGNAIAESSRYFVVASATHSVEQLRAVGAALDKVYDFFLAEYGMRAPGHLISVYLVPSAGDLQALSLQLHGIRVSPQSIGYSYQADMSMVGVVSGVQVGTLQHELFHLMVRNNFGDVPPWIDEGMAALYEVTQNRNGKVMGAPNWRGRVLRDLSGLQPRIEELAKMNWITFSGGDEDYSTARQAAIHAKARYLMLYLQDQGKLRDVYRAFQSREIGADSLATLQSALGKNLGSVESDFRIWFEKIDR